MSTYSRPPVDTSRPAPFRQIIVEIAGRRYPRRHVSLLGYQPRLCRLRLQPLLSITTWQANRFQFFRSQKREACIYSLGQPISHYNSCFGKQICHQLFIFYHIARLAIFTCSTWRIHEACACVAKRTNRYRSPDGCSPNEVLPTRCSQVQSAFMNPR